MKSDLEVEAYIDQFDPVFRDILIRLRELIYEVVPDASEGIKWRVPTFSLHKTVCYIAGFKNHVTFAFHDGKMLKDPDGLLLGTGKHMKYLKFKSIADLDEERLRLWILEGFYT
ncbi:MAG: hypothetical protein AMS23_01870 [Bacteroides sp. SM1_62]|nr:MAG: hypothetical protein AMS26_18010 [Bacteroides sp. SM23_62]KPL26405.1 MAG: hypothetical protein AMS23_01870 [Bacteroides sp. SM1_62]